jgi:hypothetical protein
MAMQEYVIAARLRLGKVAAAERLLAGGPPPLYRWKAGNAGEGLPR